MHFHWITLVFLSRISLSYGTMKRETAFGLLLDIRCIRPPPPLRQRRGGAVSHLMRDFSQTQRTMPNNFSRTKVFCIRVLDGPIPHIANANLMSISYQHFKLPLSNNFLRFLSAILLILRSRQSRCLAASRRMRIKGIVSRILTWSVLMQ